MKLLVVDDEVDLCRLMREHFEEHFDCEVYIATSGGEALRLLEEERPEGMLLDKAPAVYPDVTLDAALRLLADNPILCVASRDNPQTPIGVLALADVRRAYGFPEDMPRVGEVTGVADKIDR